MKEFRVRLKVRNNRLIRYREELGLTLMRFSVAVGVAYKHYTRYEALDRSPLSTLSTTVWKRSARKIAAFHGVDPEELWPDVVLQMKNTMAERTMGAEELSLVSATSTTALCTASVADDFDSTELRAAVGGVLLDVTYQERKILAMRFGLLGEHTHRLEDVGVKFNVTRERIRQIETKALRKLRYPSRAVLLKPFVDTPNHHEDDVLLARYREEVAKRREVRQDCNREAAAKRRKARLTGPPEEILVNRWWELARTGL